MQAIAFSSSSMCTLQRVVLRSSRQRAVLHMTDSNVMGDVLDSYKGLLESKSLSDLVKKDNIFRIHSVGALGFGSLLLLFPGLLLSFNPQMDFAYRQWSIFILAVAYITFKAPTLPKETKEMLATTYMIMCGSECFLYINDIVFNFNPLSLIIDGFSLAVFAALAYGYFASGLTNFSKKA